MFNINSYELLYMTITIIVIIYGSLARIDLNENIYNNNIFKFIVLMSCALIGTKNIYISFIIAILILLISQYNNNILINEYFENKIIQNLL